MADHQLYLQVFNFSFMGDQIRLIPAWEKSPLTDYGSPIRSSKTAPMTHKGELCDHSAWLKLEVLATIAPENVSCTQGPF